MTKHIVVTGAAGFLGGRTAKFLASHFDNYRIVGTSRRNNRVGELAENNCEFMQGDLTDISFCNTLTKNAEIIVHCAALSAPFGPYDSFYKSNFIASQSLLNAAIKNKVGKFIFISTPSIYFNFDDRFNVSESDILPKKMVNNYAKTKYLAEQLVLKSNNKGIQTIALRPRAIIGAEDTVIFPRMLEAYHKGKLRIVGDGKNKCDMTCARNVIESIICAIAAPSHAYGEAYNITDGEAVNFWEALNYTLTSLNLMPPQKKVPKSIAMLAARVLEMKTTLLREKEEPPLTRYGVGILSNHFTLDISKAISKLNYKPIMNTYDGINEYVTWHKKKI